MGGAKFTTPTDANLAQYTQLAASPSEQAVAAGANPDAAPFSGVQFSPNGSWGAVVNTTGADPTKEHLTTTTLESEWWNPDAGECFPVFADGGGLQVELELEVPTAFKLRKTDNACAVSG